MSLRLHALRVGNFKAFADAQRIPLKPITLVFGPNSAGKSSFIHSFALAHEAQFGREKRGLSRLDVHHTEIGGSAIDLGGFRRFVHRGKASNRVEWGADLDLSQLKSDDKQKDLSEMLDSISSVFINIYMGIELDDQDRPKPSADPRVESIEISADGEWLMRTSRRRSPTTEDGEGSLLRMDRVNDGHIVIRRIIAAVIEAFTLSVEVRDEDFTTAGGVIAELLPDLVVKVDPFLPTSVENTKPDLGDMSPASALQVINQGTREEKIANAIRFYLPRRLNDLVKGLSGILAEELKKFQYLGPLRSFPPRHLALAENEDANWYAGGGYAWDVVRRDDDVRDAVNNWLGSDKLKTPYRLMVRSLVDTQDLHAPIEHALDHPKSAWLSIKDVEELIKDSDLSSVAAAALEESDDQNDNWLQLRGALREGYAKQRNKGERDQYVHRMWVELNNALAKGDDGVDLSQDLDREAKNAVDVIERYDIPKLRELVLMDIRKDTVVTHRDVGIGISQVLPVLVMAYGSQGKLLAMEQPEIHLHPALQAELGDVFIESALGERKNTFVLETHSEHLILRLMRRIREGKLSPDDVSVIFAEPLAQGSRFLELRIDEEGDFMDEWPGGFFEESFHEKFAGR